MKPVAPVTKYDMAGDYRQVAAPDTRRTAGLLGLPATEHDLVPRGDGGAAAFLGGLGTRLVGLRGLRRLGLALLGGVELGHRVVGGGRRHVVEVGLDRLLGAEGPGALLVVADHRDRVVAE